MNKVYVCVRGIVCNHILLCCICIMCIYIYSNYVRHTYPLIDLDIACGESLD